MPGDYRDYLAQTFGNAFRPVLGPPAPQPLSEFGAMLAAMPERDQGVARDMQRTATANPARARLGEVTPDLGSNRRPTYDVVGPLLTDAGDPGLGETHPYDAGMDINRRGWWWWMLRHPDRLADFLYHPHGGASRGGYNQGT